MMSDSTKESICIHFYWRRRKKIDISRNKAPVAFLHEHTHLAVRLMRAHLNGKYLNINNSVYTISSRHSQKRKHVNVAVSTSSRFGVIHIPKFMRNFSTC